MVPQTGGGRAVVTTPLVSPLRLGFVPLDVFIQQVLLGFDSVKNCGTRLHCHVEKHNTEAPHIRTRIETLRA